MYYRAGHTYNVLEYISKERQAPNIAFQWALIDQQVEKVLRKSYLTT